MALSIYVHVPFCRSRCAYCGFYSGEPLAGRAAFGAALLREASLRRPAWHTPGPLASIYLGGGSPALLGASRISRLLTRVDRLWGLASDTEITVEVNPADQEAFGALRAVGVNRLSLGVQALAPAVLNTLGRRQTQARTLDALAAAAAAGFPRTSADLVVGLPAVAPQLLADTTAQILDHGVTHLSVYSLELHPGTPLAKAAARRRFPTPTAESEDAQWQAVVDAARGYGLQLYEVSNLALPGHASVHNRAYWTGAAYLGLGPGAHSFCPSRGPFGTRRWNRPGLEPYLTALAAGTRPPDAGEVLDRSQALLESLFLGLRQDQGVDLARLQSRFGVADAALRRPLEALVAEDLAVCRDARLYPTAAGMRRADGIALWLAGDWAPAA